MATETYRIGEWGYNEDSPLGRIDFQGMLRDKLGRTREKMKKYDLDAVLCLNEVNVEYTTNIPAIFPAAGAIGGNRYAIVPASGDPVGFEECQTAYHLRRHLPDLRIEYSISGWGGPNVASAKPAQEYMAGAFAEQVAAVLKEMKVKGRVGVDYSTPLLSDALKKEGIELVPEGSAALLEARAVKTPWELQCFRGLTTVIDGCFATMAKYLRPGVTEREVFAKCLAYAFEQGVTVNGGFMVSGPHTWPKDNTSQATNRRIKPGDVVYADFFNFGYFGYRSCYYRSFFVGHAPKDVKETHNRVFTWLNDAEKAVKKGATTADVVATWPDEDKLWGSMPPFVKTKREQLSTFWMNMGHGLGLSLYEPPFFWRQTALKWPQKLEANTAIALETIDCTPDARTGVRIEDMILVTDTGHEVLSKWPREEITEVPLY